MGEICECGLIVVGTQFASPMKAPAAERRGFSAPSVGLKATWTVADTAA